MVTYEQIREVFRDGGIQDDAFAFIIAIMRLMNKAGWRPTEKARRLNKTGPTESVHIVTVCAPFEYEGGEAPVGFAANTTIRSVVIWREAADVPLQRTIQLIVGTTDDGELTEAAFWVGRAQGVDITDFEQYDEAFAASVPIGIITKITNTPDSPKEFAADLFNTELRDLLVRRNVN